MKVFFNHLAKCGGSSIERIAKEQYDKDFYILSGSTDAGELNAWLEKDHVFIASELSNVGFECIQILISRPDIKRIVLTRDPIARFESFCAHSTRNFYVENSSENNPHNKPIFGIAFLGNEQHMPKPISCEGWLSGSLDRIERRLLAGASTSLDSLDDGLIFSVYSQWWLTAFKSSFNSNTSSFVYCGSDYFKHIVEMRKNSLEAYPHITDLMARFLRSFYSVVGSLEKIDIFISRLVDEGIFLSRPEIVPRENNSSLIRKNLSKQLSINDDRLITRYYSLVPEDFFLNSITKALTGS